MSFIIHDALPILLDMFLTLHDEHNNLCFVIDTTSSKSLVPLQTFPNLSTRHSFCVLLTADDMPIQQKGVLDLTMQFTKFRNRHFVHSCVLAGVAYLILSVNFFEKLWIHS